MQIAELSCPIAKAQDAFRHGKAVTRLAEQLLQKTDDIDLIANLLVALNGLCAGNCAHSLPLS